MPPCAPYLRTHTVPRLAPCPFSMSSARVCARVRVDVPLLFDARLNRARCSFTKSNFRWLTVYPPVLPFFREHLLAPVETHRVGTRSGRCSPASPQARVSLSLFLTFFLPSAISETIAATSTNTRGNTIHRDIQPRNRQLAISYFVGRPGSFRADGHERTPSRCRIPLVFVPCRTICSLTIPRRGLIFGRPGRKIATHAFSISSRDADTFQ